MPLNMVKQTSKAILFEQFTSAVDGTDLLTILCNEDHKEDWHQEISKKLEVNNFEEFAKKFMPDIWEWTEVTNDPNCPVVFRYSLEEPKHAAYCHKLKLSDQEFYTLVMDLYSQKGTSGTANSQFDYDKVAELLTPSRIMEKAKQLRRDLNYNYNKYLELESKPGAERKNAIRKIKEIRGEICNQYRDSFTGQLKLALADTDNKIALLDSNTNKANSEWSPEKSLPCKFEWGENGDLRPIAIEMKEDPFEVDVVGEKNQLATYVATDFDANFKGADSGRDFLKNLVVSTYCGDKNEIVALDREELVVKKRQYTALYKASQEQFISAISSAVEKMLDVKVFFDHATYEGKNLKAPLIVANRKVGDLISADVKTRFETYIKENAGENPEKRIWFAIIPAIGIEQFSDLSESMDDDLDAPIDFDDYMDEGVKSENGERLTSKSELTSLLEILKLGKIMSFFNFKANEYTSFKKLNEQRLEEYRKEVESCNGNSYAVFCYPNFSVLPKSETTIKITETEGFDGQMQPEYMVIPGVYVEASYVAAGLVVGSQNPEYLTKKGYNIKKNFPCVRFDIEDVTKHRLLTCMNREGSVNWEKSVKANILNDKFGFCFCGDFMYMDGNLIKNTYVLNARTMKKNPVSGNYETLYSRLTKDFLEVYMNNGGANGNGGRYKPENIERFRKDQVAAWKRESVEKYDNCILQVNEDINYDREQKKLVIKFKNEEAEIELVIDTEN